MQLCNYVKANLKIEEALIIILSTHGSAAQLRNIVNLLSLSLLSLLFFSRWSEKRTDVTTTVWIAPKELNQSKENRSYQFNR